MAVNASSVSPLANAQYRVQNDILIGYVGRVLDSLNGWTVALALFLGLVLYDQCELLHDRNVFLTIDLEQIGTSHRKDPFLALYSSCPSSVLS